MILFHSTGFLYKIHVSVVLDPQVPHYREIISGIIFRPAKKLLFPSKDVVALGLRQQLGVVVHQTKNFLHWAEATAGSGGAPNKTLGVGNRQLWKVMVILPAWG